MTEKEKAKELTDKFNLLVTTWDCYHDTPILDEDILKDTKQCAHIVVDETISVLKSIFGQDEDKQPDIVYLKKVKEEILALPPL